MARRLPGDGRVYRISFVADDGHGGQCESSVAVCVPRDQAHPICVDGGQRFNSLGPCVRVTHSASQFAVDATGYGLKVGEVEGTVVPVELSLPVPGRVLVTVFDIAGRRLATLEDSDLPAGVHQRAWNAGGSANGLYFVRMRAGGVWLTKAALKIR